MQRAGRVFTHAASPTVPQLLDLTQDIVASLVIHFDPLGILASEVRQAVRVYFGAEGARCWPSIFELARNLPGPALGGAVHGSCYEDHLFKLLAQRMLPALISQVMALIQQPVNSQATPTAADEGLGEGGIGTRHKIRHKRSPLLRL